MLHHTPLIATIAAGLGLAFILGVVAHRLRISPLVGYLAAGVIVGPFTPGYVADQGLATELAEIGVILLMFGVGLHFSLKDLLSVRKIAIPGAIAQMAAATLLGMGLGRLLGWTPVAGFVFGLSLSVASTVVLLRALQERRVVQTERGRIAVGWLIVEDLAMVIALVLLPVLAQAVSGQASSPGALGAVVGTTFLKVGAFVAFMLIVGRRVIPWVLHYVAHTGSRELFRLAVLSIALGVAFGAAMLFGVSFALGAFFAGMILAESELSQRAAEETLPLRDAFAVLFFVSIGMLFNPAVVVTQPLALLATILIIVVGKSLAALVIMRLFRRDATTTLTVAASLAQIGEFSFILAGLGVSLKILPPEGRDLILAGAILSILLNPLVFGLAMRLAAKTAAAAPAADPAPLPDLAGHTVLVGFGRVGQVVAEGLKKAAVPFMVVESDEDAHARAVAAGHAALNGNAADPRILEAMQLKAAARLIVAIPDVFETGAIVEEAHRANANLAVVARAHSEAEVQHLRSLGADVTILGEIELARSILEQVTTPGSLPPEAPSPLAPAPAPAPAVADSAARPILSDAQHAVLDVFRQIGAGPREAVAIQTIRDRAGHQAPAEDLDAAVESLAAEGLITDLRDGRLALTLAGYSHGPR